MATALVALGSNLDDPRSNILHAIERLEQAKRVALAKQSELMSFAPVGGPPDQPAYWNAAVLLETEAGPADVMAVLSKIEREMGRRRNDAGHRGLSISICCCMAIWCYSGRD